MIKISIEWRIRYIELQVGQRFNILEGILEEMQAKDILKREQGA